MLIWCVLNMYDWKRLPTRKLYIYMLGRIIFRFIKKPMSKMFIKLCHMYKSIHMYAMLRYKWKFNYLRWGMYTKMFKI